MHHINETDKTLSVPKIGLNYLGGHGKYGMSSGERKSLGRVPFRDINATMALGYHGPPSILKRD